VSETNVELARRGFAAIAAGDLEAVGELMAPDVKWHAGDPDSNYACHNREEALAFMHARQTPRRIGRLLEVIDVGDRVVVVMQPLEEDGVTPPPRAILTTLRDGQVAEMVGFESREAALASAGLGAG
jgi:ketosteroid isomerase-like protein